MMTKTNSRFANVKKYLAIPAFAALAVLFAERVYARENIEISTFENDNRTSNKLSNDPYSDYKNELKRYSKYLNNYDYNGFINNLTNDDKRKLYNLFIQLTDEQQDNEKISFFKNQHKIKKREISGAQFNEFLDSSKYLVSVDGKKVDNLVSSNYKKEDFVLFFITNNPESMNVPQKKTVILMTPSFYEKYLSSEEIVVGIKGQEYDVVKKDTITPKTTVHAELVEVKDGSALLDENVNVVKDLGTTTVQTPKLNSVDTLPEYPGGVNAMRNKVLSIFNGALLKGDEGVLKSEITFVIDEKGEVSNIKTNGSNKMFNDEAARAVKLANDNITWKPATKNGQSVRYRFKLPLTMSFETFAKTQ